MLSLDARPPDGSASQLAEFLFRALSFVRGRSSPRSTVRVAAPPDLGCFLAHWIGVLAARFALCLMLVPVLFDSLPPSP